MYCSSFVTKNYLKLYNLHATVLFLSTYYTHLPEGPLVHKTYTCDSFPCGCSFLVTSSANITIDSRTSRNIAWAFAHLSTLPKSKKYDCLSFSPLGNNRPQRRSKNVFREITMGIGPIWGIHSLSFILS